jgi:hypothetical protein
VLLDIYMYVCVCVCEVRDPSRGDTRYNNDDDMHAAKYESLGGNY